MGLTLLITGAGGFLGRATVAAARARGHAVVAVTRSDAVWVDPGVRVVRGTRYDPVHVLGGVDAVIHTAAAMSGDDAAHERATVAPTRLLAQAAAARPVPPRFVLVSSMSVYGHTVLRPGATVTEDTPREDRADQRDAYTRAKLAQEDVVRAALHGSDLWVLRPGAIWGPGRLWNGHLGPKVGPILLRIGGDGQIPLVHVDDCARALVLAAETPVTPAPVAVLNILGDDLPDRRRYLAAIGAGPSLPLSWRLPDLLGRLMPSAPGLLRRPTLRARMMPLRYDNARARAALGWQPRVGLDDGMAAAKGDA